MKIFNIFKKQDANISKQEAKTPISANVTDNKEVSAENYEKYSKACESQGRAFFAVSNTKSSENLSDNSKNIEYAEVIDENEIYEAIPVAEDEIYYAEVVDDNELLSQVYVFNPKEVSYSNPKLDKYTADNVETKNASKQDLELALSFLKPYIYSEWFEFFNTNNSNNLSKEEISKKAERKADLFEKYLKRENSSLMFALKHPQLFPDVMKDIMAKQTWYSNNAKDGRKCAWKMHIFSDNNMDWQNLSKVIIPYLQSKDISWKTICPWNELEDFDTNQRGKSFTIYPKSNAEMEKIAKDIDYIIRKNNLQLPVSNIVGDREMGDSGRLFYRYEYNSKQHKDKILDIYNINDMYVYDNIYESNRGKSNYLASDMTIDDDIWHNFDPSKP